MFTSKKQFKKVFEDRVVGKFGRAIKDCTIEELYEVLGGMVRDYASVDWKKSKEYIKEHEEKQLIYFSMEFLIGRLLTNNMINLGIYNVAKEGLKDLGIDLNKIEE